MEPAETAAAPAQQDSPPDLDRAAEALGVGGVEAADADADPLDKRLDKLLDGID